MRGRKNYGFDKLTEQAVEYVTSELESMRPDCSGDSEIERLFYLALYARTTFQPLDQPGFFVVKDDNRDKIFNYDWAKQAPFLIESQVHIGNRRVDFVVYVYLLESSNWKKLVVECDGHDFHERTKEQAANDRSRDRSLQLDGYEVFRFTGSELWRDPWGCADQVIEWCDKAVMS